MKNGVAQINLYEEDAANIPLCRNIVRIDEDVFVFGVENLSASVSLKTNIMLIHFTSADNHSVETVVKEIEDWFLSFLHFKYNIELILMH